VAADLRRPRGVADGVSVAGQPGSAGAPGAAPEYAAAGVLVALGARGQTFAVAESLTGGLLAATIVDVPGASAVFRGGLVVYATDLKASLAGVDAALLAERGPVDADVARQLARGAALRCGADWGLSRTASPPVPSTLDCPIRTVAPRRAGWTWPGTARRSGGRRSPPP
jgi:Competence-damaged protein